MSHAGEARFWTYAERLLARPGVSRSTMMGYPCLRVGGAFFAACDRRTGELVVKLPEARVTELVESGRGATFAPASRPFREWVAVPVSRSRTWARLLDEAVEFVAAASAAPRRVSGRSPTSAGSP